MKRALVICGLLVCGLTIFAGTATADDSGSASADLSTADVYNDAFHILASGDEKGVGPVLAQALQVFPKDARLTFFYAACYRGYFETDRATPLFQKAADLDGNGIWAQAAHAIIGLDMQLGDKDAQFKSLDDLAEANPGEPLILWMDAVQCRALKQNEIGAKRFAALLKVMSPGPAIVHHTYANILSDLGRYDDALPQRQIAVKMQPASWTYQGLANTYSQLSRWNEADDAYKLATSLNPLSALIWRNWAWSKRHRGDSRGARVDLDLADYATQALSDETTRAARLKHAAKPGPFVNDATVLYDQAIDAWRKGDQSKTEATLLSGAEQFDDDARFPFFLGVCLQAQNNLVPANREFRRAVSIDPGGVVGLAADYAMTFANPFESRHNFTGMQRIVDQRDDPATLWTAAMQATHLRMAAAGLSYYAKLAPTTDSAPAIVYTQYADCQESLSRFDEALPHRQAAIALDPSADNYQRLGITLGHLKNWADADEAYEKSTSLDPTNATRWDQWAQSKQQRGDEKAAVRLWRKADALHSPASRPSTRLSDQPATRP